jgi:N-acetylmuramoyl-L-alanine amidase
VLAKPTPNPNAKAAAPKFSLVPPPKIVTRAQWGADESIRDTRIIGWAPFRKIVVHHTASPNGVKDPATTVRFGYELHVVGRGFTDIGYNFLIGPDGQIFEGRRARKYGQGELHTGEDGSGNGIVGGHTKGRNAGTCGIALIGNFMKTSPSAAAIHSLIHLASWEAQRHRIDPLGSDEFIATDATKLVFPNIVGHRGIGSTLCPGNKIAASLPWLRKQVAERVGSFPARKADMRRLAWMINPTI